MKKLSAILQEPLSDLYANTANSNDGRDRGRDGGNARLCAHLRESSRSQDALHGPRHLGDVHALEHGREKGGGGPVSRAEIQHPLGAPVVRKSRQLPELFGRQHEHGAAPEQPVR